MTISLERRGQTHILRAYQRVPLAQADVFTFFAEVANLERITPPELEFHLLTPPPITMQAGTLIEFRLQLFKIPFRWLTRICSWNPPHEFVDEQLRGPYRLWHHTHRFVADGRGTRLEDEVYYRLPCFPWGESVHPWVGWQLLRIFTFRRHTIARLLGGGEHGPECGITGSAAS